MLALRSGSTAVAGSGRSLSLCMQLIATVKQVRPPQPPSPPAVVVLGLSHSDHLCAFCTFFARSFTEHYSPDQHVKLVPGDSKQEKAWCVGGLVYTACAVSHSGK
ncbi:hypothetical protein WJX79_007209 [Trebouxia sp. C0005]